MAESTVRIVAGMAVLALLCWAAFAPRRGPSMPPEGAGPVGDGAIDVVARFADGSPVAGYTVALFGPRGDAEGTVARTDAAGRASFSGLPTPATYAVQVADPARAALIGYDEVRVVRLDDATPRRLEIALPPTRVEGVVRGLDGTPVAGATVRAMPVVIEAQVSDPALHFTSYRIAFYRAQEGEGGAPLATCTSSPSGQFHLEVAARAFRVEAFTDDGRQGFEIGSASRGSREDVSVLLSDPAARSIDATLVDEDARPIEGAAITARDSSGGTSGPVRTDAEGRFHLALSRGTSLKVELPGAGTAIVGPFWQGAAPKRIEVARRTALALRFLDDATGAPIAGVEARLVSLRGGETGDGARAFGDGTSGAEGTVRLAAWPGTRMQVFVRVPGRSGGYLDAESSGEGPLRFAPGSFEAPAAPGEIRAIDVRSRRGTRVRGRVVFANGRPALGAAVAATHQGVGRETPTVRTGPDGRFEVADVFPPERPAFIGDNPTAGIAAHLDAYASTWRSIGREAPGADLEVDDLVLHRTTAWRVRVRDEAGRPLAKVQVRLRSHEATSGPDGVAILVEDPAWTATRQDRPEALRASLAVSARGFAPLGREVAPSADPGTLTDLGDVTLVASRGRPVRVLAADGRPVAGMHVLAALNFGEFEFARTPVTDAEGRVDVEAEDGGETVHLLDAGGGRWSAWPVPNGEPGVPLVIRLAAVRPLYGRVVDDAGAPVPGATLKARRDASSRVRRPAEVTADPEPWLAQTKADGTFSYPAVVAAPVEVAVEAEGLVSLETVIGEGASMPVELRLERFGEKHLARIAEIQARLKALGESSESSERYELELELHRLRGR